MANRLRRGASPTLAQIELKQQLNGEDVRNLWFLLTAVIGLLTLVNWSLRLWAVAMTESKRRSAKLQSQPHEKRPIEAVSPGRSGRVALRNFPVVIASVFRIVSFRTTVPIGPSSVASVAEVVFIIGYIVAILAFLLVNTQDVETFYVEDRAASLASCQLALIVGLAGKNNIISFLTGVSHEKLNVLHRAAARANLVLLWIHAITHFAAGLPEKFDLTHGWVRCGLIGLIAFTLAAILSGGPIRQKFFEFFLVSHILLILVFLICGLVHAGNVEFGAYIWPALLLWGLDRLMRGVRVMWNNRVWSRGGSNSKNASVEQLTNDTVRLTLRRKMHWKPGQHAYVILPSVSNLPTEAHPFTISSIPHNVDGTDEHPDKDVVFLIRGRTGFTRRLLEHAGRKGAEPTVSALIDGPYGAPPDLSGFSTCVLFAGGSGVSYTLPLLLDLVRRARAGTTIVQRIIFVWIIREPEHLAWIARILTTAVLSAPSSLEIDPRIHVTGKMVKLPDTLRTLEYENSSDSISGKSSGSEESKKTNTIYTAFKTKQGRPDVERILYDAVTCASGPVSVDVAGPSALASSVRSALSSEVTNPLAVLKGRQPVTLHVETFGMVKG